MIYPPTAGIIRTNPLLYVYKTDRMKLIVEEKNGKISFKKNSYWYITKAEFPPLKVKMENLSLTSRLAIDFQIL